MIILRVTNEKGQVFDLQPIEDIDLKLDISAIENTEIGVQFGISSQEFAIAGGNDANQFFGNLYNLGATPAVALQNSVDCQVLSDGQETFTGKLYIRNIITDQEGFTIYNVVVVNETIDFKYRIQNLSLNDPKFDWSAYDHDFTIANVTGSWTGGLFGGAIVYPNINYGQPEGDTDVPNYAFAGLNTAAALENTFDNAATPLRLQDFKPAIKARNVVDIIFSGSYTSGSIGYQYTSSFFEGAYFNNLYLLTTANDQLGPANNSPVSQSTWVYRSGSAQTILAATTNTIDFNATSYDNSNNYNLGTDRYTADTSGSYRVTAQINFNITNWAYRPNSWVEINAYRVPSGSILTPQIGQYRRFSPYSGSNTFLIQDTYSLGSGDQIFFQATYADPGGPLTRDLVLNPGELNTWLNVTGPTSVLGGNVQMNQQFSPDFKALDFLQGLIEKFNLVVEPVPGKNNLLSIEPYDTWTDQGTVVDWTNKVDRGINFSISHPAIEQPRTILFSDEEDDDYLNEYTRQTFGRTYGQYVFTANSDLPEGERRIGKVFAPTPTTNIPNSTKFIIPHLCTKTIGSSEAYRPIAFKPRLLYGIGVQTVESTAAGFTLGGTPQTGSYFLRNETGIVTEQTQWYQVSSLSEMPISGAAFDIHFNNNNQGYGAIPPYWSNVVPNGANFISGSGDAFTTYWANYINGLYDIDARKLVCNVYLAPNEIPSIRLNQKVFIDGAYYRINKINGANLTRRDSVEIEFIKTINRQLTFPRRRIVPTPGDLPRDVQFQGYNPNGTGRYIDFETGDIVDDYNTVSQAGPLDGLRVYRSGSSGTTGSVIWNYEAPTTPALQQSIIGTNNVAVDSSKVTVMGSKNSVGNTVSTAQIMGQYNTIESNVTNAFIIGQQNVIGETAVNTQILGGVGNYSSGSNNNLTIVGGTGSYAYNTDYSAIINGYSAGLRDSDVTTLINQHENEVVINGSGHTVIGLNKQGNGIDLLEYRNNSNYMGDTYMGGAYFTEYLVVSISASANVNLFDNQYKNSSLFILQWSGTTINSGSITLPNASNNDYKKTVLEFKNQGTTGGVKLLPFSAGQNIDGATSYLLSGTYDYVKIIASGSQWLILG